jgi:crotonobetaine/carnitine-CoA ligase
MRMLLAQPPDAAVPPHRLRVAMFAQNVTAQQLTEWDDRFGVPLLQIYGMTETIGQPLMNPLYYARKNDSLGLPVPGYRCRIVDERGLAVPVGQVGQLLVGGDLGVSLMQGYFKDSAATAAAYRDGWLSTGDNVRADQDGYVYFVDRSKDMIKRAGENVAASEVEAVIKQHPAVFDAAVIGVPDPMRDESIKAFVILNQGETIAEDDILEWCRPRLASFRVPDSVEFRDDFPRTSVGKIQKHLLRRDELATRGAAGG